MKTTGFLLVLVFVFSAVSFGQPLPSNPGMRNTTVLPVGREAFIVHIEQPLIYIGALETNYNSLILDLNNLRILETYTDSTQLEQFGEKGRAGVIIGELKIITPLLRLEEVLDYFQIPASKQHLKVLIDKKFINRELFLADIEQIEKIEHLEVTQQDILLSPFYKNEWVLGEKYLNIVTKD